MDGCTNSQIDPMKIIIILITALFVSSAAFSADSLKTTITKATVFLSGAQVFRQSKTVTVKKGVNEFIIKDVSPYLNQGQIQATSKGSCLSKHRRRLEQCEPCTFNLRQNFFSYQTISRSVALRLHNQ